MKTHNMADETSVVVSRKESVENPFNVDGVLSQKASYIISHSTITRNEIHIADPDALENNNNSSSNINQSDEIVPHKAPNCQGEQPHSRLETNPKGESQSMVVEVSKVRSTLDTPQKAEEINLKKKKKCGKCCTIA